MILDGHVHMRAGGTDGAGFVSGLEEAGVDGAIVLSPHPKSPPGEAGGDEALQSIDEVMQLATASPNIYPFFFINPTCSDAAQQVEKAVDSGIAGFKVICSAYYPGDERAMDTYRLIAEKNKPILFHSGILWGFKPSSVYNRPVNFEVLFEIEGIRFAMAHISWPWCDELLAVYGKYAHHKAHSPECKIEMYIDNTRGTPDIYRKGALEKVYTIGYDIENNFFFGTDSSAPKYGVEWVKDGIAKDKAIYAELGLSEEQQEKAFSKNLLRFVNGPE